MANLILSVGLMAVLLPILMLYQFVDGTQVVLANALRGLSDVKPIMWISSITNFLVVIPAGYILGYPLGMGISGVWLAYPIGFVFSVTLPGPRARKTMNPQGICECCFILIVEFAFSYKLEAYMCLHSSSNRNRGQHYFIFGSAGYSFAVSAL